MCLCLNTPGCIIYLELLPRPGYSRQNCCGIFLRGGGGPGPLLPLPSPLGHSISADAGWESRSFCRSHSGCGSFALAWNPRNGAQESPRRRGLAFGETPGSEGREQCWGWGESQSIVSSGAWVIHTNASPRHPGGGVGREVCAQGSWVFLDRNDFPVRS